MYFFLLGSYMSFMHPYYAGLILVWTGFYTIGYLLVTRASIAAYLKHLLPMVLAVTGVALVFKGLMFFTDNVTDRTNYPYGILSYCTSLGDLFVSEYSLFGTLLNSFSIRTSSSNEGFAYIGLVPIMVVCVILGICISSRIFRHRELERYGDEVVFPRIWIFIALSSLLLAMGIPFIWHMEWMLNYVSVIRQFRSLGRFSWVFYYIITVYGVIMLYAFCARKYASGKKAQAVLFLLLPMIIWALEANGYVITVRKKMEKATGNYRFYFAWNDPKDWKDILNEHHYIKDDFQAIMFLPYMNIGSDKLWLNGDCSWLYSLTTKAIMQLNLPMIDALMARTSWSQVFNQVKIIGGPFSDKPILRSINDKPILLLVGEDKKIDPDTHWLLQASDSLQHYSQAYVYALYPKRLIKNEKQVRDSVVALLPHINRDSLVGSNDYYFIEHFDKVNERGSIFWGNGSQDAIKERKKIVYTIPVSERADSALYEFSCWSLVNDHNYSSPGIFLDLYNASGNPISSIALAGIESTDNEGMWLRISKYFQLPANCRSISVRVINEPNPTYFALDEIVLRPADGITISKDADGKVLANNHVFRK